MQTLVCAPVLRAIIVRDKFTFLRNAVEQCIESRPDPWIFTSRLFSCSSCWTHTHHLPCCKRHSLHTVVFFIEIPASLPYWTIPESDIISYCLIAEISFNHYLLTFLLSTSTSCSIFLDRIFLCSSTQTYWFQACNEGRQSREREE